MHKCTATRRERHAFVHDHREERGGCQTGAMSGAGRQEATEQWFISRGMPHFIADYSASRDVFTRTLPVLTLVFLFEFGGAFKADWTWWENMLAAVGGQLAQAAGVATANLALLGTIYLITSYGLIPLTRWAVLRVFRELGAVVGLLSRALPLLLLFATFLFINTEAWQVTSALERPFLIATVVLFVILGAGFLLTHLPGELDQLSKFDSVDQVIALCEKTPAEVDSEQLTVTDLKAPDLTGRQRGNAALVVLVSETIQVTLVAVLIGAFFVLFGLVAIRPSVIETWVGHANVLWDSTIFGLHIALTKQLVKVSTFLGAFSGFYFTVYVITDSTYREQFFDEVVADIRQAFAVRTAYLSARR